MSVNASLIVTIVRKGWGDTVLEGVGGGFGSPVRVDLGVDVRQMPLHRRGADEESIGDLLVGVPAGDEAQYIHFARGEGVGAREGLGARALVGQFVQKRPRPRRPADHPEVRELGQRSSEKVGDTASIGSSGLSRSHTHAAITSLVGFDSPSTSFRQ